MAANAPSLEEIRAQMEHGDRPKANAELQAMIAAGAVAPDVHRLLAFAHLRNGESASAIPALR